MKNAIVILGALLISACSGYRTPSASQDPTKLSDHTLCYRSETTGKSDLRLEVKRRKLDCRGYIESDPLLNNRRY